MTTAASTAPGRAARIPWIHVLAAFSGAALIFMVQPMVAKLVLPQLGGSPAVWNTSMAFFQAALLVGYGYAHLLQKIGSLKVQGIVHIAVMLVAALALPLRITGIVGEPSSDAPILWLLGVLAISVGPPFAALSATAPLVQAWHARKYGSEGEGGGPWSLYAASNLGSLLALLAYPILVEPTLALADQRIGWSLGYGAFVLIMAALAFRSRDARSGAGEEAVAKSPAIPGANWLTRLTWIALAAIPSSLMLGVTTHLTTDVASAPFLWVAPLALYLLTFIIAFQAKPLIRPGFALQVQAAFLVICLCTLPFNGLRIELTLAIHLLAFFLTALVCHQALVERRPDARNLTEFYLCMSLGGVLGGAFNAFVAPVIFSTVIEYPLVLVLSCLVRPWGRTLPRPSSWIWGVTIAGVMAATLAAVMVGRGPGHGPLPVELLRSIPVALLIFTAVTVYMVRDRAILMTVTAAMLILATFTVTDRVDTRHTYRSFFGVLKESQGHVRALGGPVRMLAHGTTLHGAQAMTGPFHCVPLLYYAPETPIGQVFTRRLSERPSITVGAVGLGTGAVAAYTRPGDALTFFEIDPLVIRLSSDPSHFSYTTTCAHGKVDYVLGDARLKLAQQPANKYDLLLIDAFSSDAVPAHLLTVEAVRMYLSRLKADGVVILHLSNRHLKLSDPAAAVARAAGGYALWQRHQPPHDSPPLRESREEVLIIARTPQALAAYRADPRWEASPQTTVRPWTDDYTNLIGAMVGRMREELDRNW